MERFVIIDGLDKKDSPQQEAIKNEYHTSPWMQIEASIARTLELPLIILMDSTIKNEGILDTDNTKVEIYDINVSNPNINDQKKLKRNINSWIKQVKMFSQMNKS